MEPLTLTQLTAAVARRWRVVVVGALVGLVAGAAVQTALPTRFEAVTVVHVEAADPDRLDMTAEQSAAVSRRVVVEAVDTWGEGAPSTAELEEGLSARAVTDSAVLRIRYVAGTPSAAARGADAVANAYLAARSVDAAQRADRVQQRLSREMRGLDRQARAAIAAEQARAALLDTEGGEIVDGARSPRRPVGPGLAATALGGLVLGLLAAVPLAARPTRRRGARAS